MDANDKLLEVRTILWKINFNRSGEAFSYLKEIDRLVLDILKTDLPKLEKHDEMVEAMKTFIKGVRLE